MRQLSVWYSSQVFIITSNESSGVRTWTASSVRAQARATAARAAGRRRPGRSGGSGRGRGPRRHPGRAAARSAGALPGARLSGTCERRARIEPGAEALGQGRRRCKRGRGRQRAVAAEERCAGRRSRRAPARWRAANATRRAGVLGVGVAREHRADRRVVAGHDVQVLPVARRPEQPLPVGEQAQRPRSASPGLASVSTESFTGSVDVDEDLEARGRGPAACGRESACAGRVPDFEAAPPSRGSGPGVGDQTSPDSSSRRNSASAVGSITGSLANGVSRCSRLLTAQVCAAPTR